MELEFFMGYHMPPDDPWKGDYYVLHIEDLARRECHRRPRWPMIDPHRTKLASLPEEGIAFPMRAKYIFANRTVEGEEKFTEERNVPVVRESPLNVFLRQHLSKRKW